MIGRRRTFNFLNVEKLWMTNGDVGISNLICRHPFDISDDARIFDELPQSCRQTEGDDDHGTQPE